MPSIGTRLKQQFWQGRAPTRTINQSYTRDVGMAARVVDTVTFSGPNVLTFATAGNGLKFPVGARLEIRKTNFNNGRQQVLSNASTTVAVDDGAKAEGPIATVEVRTA
jgi:hypothetical protein